MAEILDTYRSTAHIKILGLVSAGPINGVLDVAIDKVPLKNPDGTSNFSKADGSQNLIVPQVSLGTATQPPFEGFSEVESEFPVNKRVKHYYPVEKAVSGQDIDQVRVTVGIPRLLRQNASTGGAEPAAVTFSVAVSSQGGPYVRAAVGYRWESRPAPTGPIIGMSGAKIALRFRTRTELVFIPRKGDKGDGVNEGANSSSFSGADIEKAWNDFKDKVKDSVGWGGPSDSERDVSEGKMDAAAGDTGGGGTGGGDTGGGGTGGGHGGWSGSSGNYQSVHQSAKIVVSLVAADTAKTLTKEVEVNGEGSLLVEGFILDPAVSYSLQITGLANAEVSYCEGMQLLAPWDYVRVEEKISSHAQFQYTLRMADFGPAPWIVRVTRETPDTADTAVSDEITFDSITEVQLISQTYPGMALVGLRLDAADFPNGVGERQYLVEGLKVPVFSNYDPVGRRYTGPWDGRMSAPGDERFTENPALLFNGVIKSKTAGLGKYLGSTNVDPALLYRVAQYCDGIVPSDRPLIRDGQVVKDASGKVVFEGEPRFTLGVQIKERLPAEELLQRLGSVMRTISVAAEGSWMLFQDAPAPIEYIFNNSNVENGVFQYEGSDLRSRHSAAIVKYCDGRNFDEEDFVYVQSREAVKRYGLQIAEVEAWGTRTSSQAKRYGRSVIFADCYPTDMVQFTTGAEARLLLPGKMFAINDVLKTGELSGGRVASFDPITHTVELDSEITFATGGYITLVDTAGTLLAREVVGVRGRRIDIRPAYDQESGELLSFDVAVDSPWNYAKPTLITRRYVCVRRELQDHNKFTISAAEVNPGKWDYVDYGDEPDALDHEEFQRVLQPPASASITTSTTLVAGVPKTVATATWDAVKDVARYRVAYRLAGDSWQTQETTAPELSIGSVAPGELQILVWSISAFGLTSATAAKASAVVTGTLPAPEAPTQVQATLDPARGVRVSWEVLPNLRYGVTGTLLGKTTTIDADNTKGFVDLPALPLGSHRFTVTATNLSGVSGGPTTTDLTLNAPAAPVTQATSGDGTLRITCQPPASSYDLAKYVASREGQRLESPSNIINVPVSWTGGTAFSVFAVDVMGNEGATTTVTAESVPPTVYAPNASVVNGRATLRWSVTLGSTALAKYVVSAPGLPTRQVGVAEVDIAADWAGMKVLTIRAYDVLGQYGEVTISVDVPVIGAPTVTHAFDGTNCRLIWTVPANLPSPVDYYQVEVAGKTPFRVSGTTTNVPADWLGSKVIQVVPYSATSGRGQAGSVTVAISAPVAPTMRQAFIDRSVEVGWTSGKGTLEVRDYLLKGAGSVTSTPALTVTLAVTFASQRVEVAARDVAGNVGPYAALTVTVSAPPAPVVAAKVVDGVALLTWTQALGSLPVEEWEVSGTGLETQTLRATAAQVVGNWIGAKTINVRARDVRGTYSTFAATVVTLTASDTTLAQKIVDLTSTVGSNKASADVAIATLTNADSAMAQRVDSLQATVSSDVGALTSRLSTVETVAGAAAKATDLNAVSARLNTGGDIKNAIDAGATKAELTAQVNTLNQAITTAGQSQASRSDAIEARLNTGDIKTAIGAKADKTALDAAVTRLTTAETNIAGRATTTDLNALRTEVRTSGRNMLDVSGWIPDATRPAQYNLNGSTDENSFMYAPGPFGDPLVVWRCVADGSSNNDGGWNHNSIAIDPRKSYRFSVWLRPVSGRATSYLGTSTAKRMTGVVDSNPYFAATIHDVSGVPLINGRWYLMVGFRLSCNYTGADQRLSGIYDAETGLKVSNGTDFLSQATDTAVTHRAYQYYGSAGAEQWFALPRMELLDGNEPTVADLLAGGARTVAAGLATRLTTVEAEVAGKASASDLSSLQVRVASAEAGITTANQARIDGDAVNAQSINALTTRVGAAESGITAANKARVDGDAANAQSINQVNARMAPGGDINTALLGKAPQAALDAVVTRITAAETSIAGKASSTELTQLKATVSSNARVGAALNADPGCLDLSAWVTGGHGPLPDQVAVSDGKSSPKVFRSAPGSSRSADSTVGFPCDSSKRYRISCWVRRSADATGVFYLRYVIKNALGDSGSNVAPEDVIVGGFPAEDVKPTTTWTRCEATFRPVAGATLIAPRVILNWNNQPGYHEVQDIRIEEVVELEKVGGLPAALAAKAAQTALDATNTRLATAETQLSTKAAASTVETLQAEVNRRKTYRLFTRGNSFDGRIPIPHGGIKTAAGALVSTVTRSYVVARFNAAGDVSSSNGFDVYSSAANAQAMADHLNAIPAGELVCVYSFDEPANFHTTPALVAAMSRFGASPEIFGKPFRSRSVYAMFGKAATLPGTAHEVYVGSVDNDPAAYIDLSFDVVNGTFAGISPMGNAASSAALSRVATVESAVAGKAAASDVTTLQARVGTAESSVTTLTSAQATLEGKVSGKYGIAVDVTLPDGRKKLSGLQAFNDGTTSKFVITADQLLVQSTASALNPDPYMQDLSAWTARVGTVDIVQVADGKAGNNALRNTSTKAEVFGARARPFDPSKSYRVRVWARSVSGANGTAYIGLQLLDSSGANISGNGSFWYTSIQKPAATWTELVGYIGPNQALVPPATARSMTPVALLNYDGTAGYMELQAFEIEEVVPGTLIQGGSINTGHLAALAVTAEKLNVSKLSAITANLGTVNAGVLNMQSDGAGGWAKIQSNGKWWNDDADGWVLGRHPTDGSFVEFKGGSTQLQMSSWGTNILKFGDKFEARGDGYVRMQRLSVAEPPVVASNTYNVTNSWWLGEFYTWSTGSGSGDNGDRQDHRGYRPTVQTIMIDTGITYQDGWNVAPSDMFAASATISGGMSRDGGGIGYGTAVVAVGDGLGSGGYADNRIYICYTYQHSGQPIFITQVKWKLVRI
jgi:predicted phage tail protein